MKSVMLFLLLVCILSCNADKTDVTIIPKEMKFIPNVIQPKMVGFTGLHIGFIVIVDGSSELPVVYKVDRPRRGFMDGVHIEKWYQEPSLGFDGKEFNQIRIPSGGADVVLLYCHEQGGEWIVVPLVGDTFDKRSGRPIDQSVPTRHYNLLSSKYTEWINSID